MKTLDEAISLLVPKEPDAALSTRVDETIRQFMVEPSLMRLAMHMTDSSGGQSGKILFALVFGMLIGIEMEK